MADEKNAKGIVHDFDKENNSLITSKYLAILGGVILLGIVTGFVISRTQNAPVNATIATNTNGQAQVKKGDVFGANDTSAFKDTAQGQLANGGQDGEGQYHLVRPGGDSQNVYLVSSTVDLSKLVGHKVQVWGATQTAQHVGWLMDVGKVEVTE